MTDKLLIKLNFPAVPDRLRLVRSVVSSAAELAGCRADVAAQIVIAVNEACMNIIQHGYKDDPSGEIILEIHNNGQELEFNLTDFAAPVDPEALCPRDLDDIRPGGLGTHFIQEIMDNWVLRPLPDAAGNSLSMTKRIE